MIQTLIDMAIERENPNVSEVEIRPIAELDELDIKILDKMVVGAKSKEIASSLGKPLSTVQRRIRQLFAAGAVSSKVDIDYKRLGLKKGELFVYVRNGNVREIAKKLTEMEGILRVSIHIGNSDIIVTFMYRDSTHLLEFTSAIRDMHGVDRVVWSEEIYNLPLKQVRKLDSIMRYQGV